MESSQKQVTLHMVGNSHIDPVWFWNKEEGLQEAKATFLSALQRMEEYPDFTFTASSSYLFRYLEEIDPTLFARIKARVAEGRFEIAGGWVVEADCCMPDGESLVRQGLYGQRYFQSRFHKHCTIGFAPDTFGHAETIPMLIKGAGMDIYCHQRPNSPIHALSNWKSPDGSEVLEFHLPSEYTIWFEEQLQKAIELCLPHIPDGGALPCFYGVGNHGGGPTIQNIETVKRYAQHTTPDGHQVTLTLSTLQDFFSKVDRATLPETSGGREGLGGGCYAVDAQLKRQMRTAEHSALRAEKLWTMAALMGCSLPTSVQNPAAEMESIWQDILFNQFHDIICGTSIQSAQRHALIELGGATARARTLENYAIQAIANRQNTQGDGFPLFLFNPHLEAFDGMMEVEIPWFCKAQMLLLDESGKEVPYQRVKTECTMVNFNLSGRRRIVFPAKIPSFGFAVYRLAEREPDFETDMGAEWITVGLPVCEKEHRVAGKIGRMLEDDLGFVLENERISVTFDPETGLPSSVLDKETKYEALAGAMELLLYHDTGDTWGSGGRYLPCGERLEPVSVRLIEDGFLRKVVKVESKAAGCSVKWRFTLYAGAKELQCSVRICHDRGHKSLVWRLPLAGEQLTVRAQIPHGTAVRPPQGKGNYMQGFLDISNLMGHGLSLLNNGRYCYTLTENILTIPLARSAIYAQGGFKGWQNDNLDLEYTDTGLLDCDFVLAPHGEPVSNGALHHRSMLHNQPIPYLFDTWHTGEEPAKGRSLLRSEECGMTLTAAKPAEDGGILLRFLETAGTTKTATIEFPAQNEIHPLPLTQYGLTSLLLRDQAVTPVNLLEEFEK